MKSSSQSNRKLFFVVLIVLVLFLLIEVCSPSSATNNTTTTPPAPHPSATCGQCLPSHCANHNCTKDVPYLCVLPHTGVQQCSIIPPSPGHCAFCCDVRDCYRSTCNMPCNSSVCAEPTRCPIEAPYMCLGGRSKNGCSTSPKTWTDTSACSECCDVTDCTLTTMPPSTIPACSQAQCNNSVNYCPPASPVYCFTGEAAGGCLTVNEALGDACSSSCDTSSCPPPPTQAPFPPSPWDLVPKSKNCSIGPNNTHYGPEKSPDPRATPFGGIDVSHLGCKAWVTESCCGYTPRFNWILSTCSSNASERLSMACRHKGANATALELRYIAAYQWDSANRQWNKDPTSSTPIHPNGDLDLSPYRNGGKSSSRSDWDLKYAPTTERQGTNGVGPPGMMFVMSAKHIAFAALFALNQITLNRGPGFRDNCWGSSSGELDFLEVPFWEGIDVPINRWYVTTTADAGRCLPSQKNIPRFLNSRCSDERCCEMCSCPNGTVCFGQKKDIGFEAMGCINVSDPLPNNTVSFDVQGDNLTCGKHFGAVSGGATSNAYFETSLTDGDRDVMYAIVVDHDGTFVYRWHANQSDYVWPGLTANSTAPIIKQRKPNFMKMQAPCPPMILTDNKTGRTTLTPPCGIWEPSCVGDCPLIAAGGNFGESQVAGAYAAESARDNLNWWDIFESTQQSYDSNVTDVDPEQLPHSVHIKIVIPSLPYYCNHSCGKEICDEATHCPYDSPYQCTEGDAFGGCNTNDRFWPLSPYCQSCCDVSFCEFNCTVCPVEYCVPEAKCGTAAPYLCYQGNASGGCSSDPTFWGTEPSCTACCYCVNEIPSSTTTATTPNHQHPETATAMTTDDPIPPMPTLQPTVGDDDNKKNQNKKQKQTQTKNAKSFAKESKKSSSSSSSILKSLFGHQREQQQP